MKILITAAGFGNRFKEKGFKTPKYKIIANEKPLFYWSILSLTNFSNYEFILIFRNENCDKDFINKWMNELNIKNWKIINIDYQTRGQAETAMVADKFIDEDESVLIFNIDTYLKPECINENILLNDGTIVTTNVDGDRWSFARLDNEGLVNKVSEKIRISNNASVGLYYFKKWIDFKNVFNNHLNEIIKDYKEIYICPMYQYLIDKNKKISIYSIQKENFICLGTPEEVTCFDKNWTKNNN